MRWLSAQTVTSALVIAVGIGGVVWVAVAPMGKSSPSAPAEPPPSLSVGDLARIRARSGNRVFAFESRSGLDESVKSAVAHDEVGFRQALTAATPIDSGTTVRILERTWNGQVRVRIQSGPVVDGAYWLPIEDLVP